MFINETVQCNHCGTRYEMGSRPHQTFMGTKRCKGEDLDMRYYSLDNLQTLCVSPGKINQEHHIRFEDKNKSIVK